MEPSPKSTTCSLCFTGISQEFIKLLYFVMDCSLLPFNSYIVGYVLQIIYRENITYKSKDANGSSENIVTTREG